MAPTLDPRPEDLDGMPRSNWLNVILETSGIADGLKGAPTYASLSKNSRGEFVAARVVVAAACLTVIDVTAQDDGVVHLVKRTDVPYSRIRKVNTERGIRTDRVGLHLPTEVRVEIDIDLPEFDAPVVIPIDPRNDYDGSEIVSKHALNVGTSVASKMSISVSQLPNRAPPAD